MLRIKIISGVAVIIIWCLYTWKSDEYQRNFFLKQNFSGIVMRKYFKEFKHQPYVIIQGYDTSFSVGNFTFFNVIDSGDLLIKRKSELKYTLIKNSGDTIRFEAEWL